ncbi:MAG: bifunctional 2-polyprenyl-6-hydroxyphenol methylase/3-demethylubiquinol 3-O-methyltransferase UbiG [Gammaproteobacteria bacterium]|nr:bifunctional 2-polyprenyl-6-hydroxyphenol methylase/3-demethylubiquinol 3-O-methyltransferase UbiG [Gammaproteobacteria bacterium]
MSKTQQTNVDPAEIEKFQSIASRWWDTESEFKPLHDINPLRIAYIEQACGGLEGKKVLDIGCGGGILSEALAAKGAIVTGIDLAEKSLNIAQLHLYESGLEVDYQFVSAEEFALQHKAEFDVVCCLEMLEHVPDPGSIIQSAHDLVCETGDVIFSTLNRNPKSFLLAIVGAEYVMNMVPKGTHEYKSFIKPSELCRSARQAGLEIKDISGMTYNPLTGIYKIGRDVDVNYFIHGKKR